MEKAYETYKDSGVEWIGDIPESWDSIKLKFLGYLYSGLSGKKGDDFRREDSEFNKHYIPFTNIANNFQIDSEKLDTVEIFENENQNDVKKNDLFFLMSSENYDDIGKTSVLKDELNNTYLNSFCKGFRLYNQEEVDASFLNYLLSGDIYRKTLSIEAKGFTRINLQMGKIENLPVIIPNSKQEQTQIAAYLDYHTQLIDTLISKKETLIQKLQEQRQAIINEAVTKGLNKNVALKDSGIEWLGEIPKHWEVVKLKFLGESITGITYSPNDVSEKGTLVLRSSNIQKGKLDLQDTVYVNKKIADKYISQKGDILLCSRNGSRNLIGKNIILDERVENETWGAFMTVYRSNFNDFIYYFFNSDIFSALSSLFLSSTINQLTIGVLNNMQIAFPKKQKEREQIVHYLKQETEETNTTIYKIQTSIQKLKDYRESLISEAVTGKIDVRDWQKPNN